jgi:hypothetical protein
MEWTTKEGKTLNVEDMDDTHACNVIQMLLRNNKPQVLLECLLVGRKKLLDDIELRKTKRELVNYHIALQGDMAQDFNDNYPKDEYDDWDYDERWNPNYL